MNVPFVFVLVALVWFLCMCAMHIYTRVFIMIAIIIIRHE